jgi:hypothetical protein
LRSDEGNAEFDETLLQQGECHELRQDMERAYRNLGYFLLVIPPIFLAGFWIPYFSRIPNFDASITTTVHVHAVLLFGWVGLLIVQPFAIRYRAFRLHRILGRISYVLMPLVILSAIAMIAKEYREHLVAGATFAGARNDEFLSAVVLVALAAFYGLALARIRKRDVASHMRYMICIVLVLLPAGLGRALGYWFGVRLVSSQSASLAVIDICLIALIVFDRRRNLTARPYIVALAIYVVIELSWFAMGRPI